MEASKELNLPYVGQSHALERLPKPSLLRRIGGHFIPDSSEVSHAKWQMKYARIGEKIAIHGIKNVKGIVVVPTSLGAPITTDAEKEQARQRKTDQRVHAEEIFKAEKLQQLGVSKKKH